jgi:Zn finger protein HypA/HybF involved in hydrogenase expression
MTNSLPAWQPPPDFMPVDSALPGISVFAPRPTTAQDDAPQAFKCPQCGASTKFDVAAGSVACEHCGYTAAPQAQIVGLRASVMEFTLETLSKAELGWGVARKEMHCNSCGADMAIAENALSATCPFCASHRVNVREAPDDQLRPRFLIPFKIEPQATRALAQSWLGKGWYHPDELGASAIVDRFTGIYLPFWTFSAQIASDWKAQVGYERQESYYDNNDKAWKTRTRIDWRWEKGRVNLGMADLLICGSSRVSQVLVKQLSPFQLKDLVSYAPDFLAGWQAQTYDLTLPKAWEQGKAEMREQARRVCHNSIKSSHVRNFSMTADFAEETWRYVLLPVYLAAYKFEDKVYQVMLNGQTGAIAGQKPVAWWKIWLAVAAMLTPGLCLGLLGLPLLLAGGIGIIPLILGVFALIAGLAGVFYLYRKAAASEAI